MNYIENDYIEHKVWFAVCNCGWEDDVTYASADEIPTCNCPECGNDAVDVESEWV